MHGPALDHDSALIDAGLNVQWTQAIGIYFGYNGQVGTEQLQLERGDLQRAFSFQTGSP